MVYTADLKSAAARIEGSSPSPATGSKMKIGDLVKKAPTNKFIDAGRGCTIGLITEISWDNLFSRYFAYICWIEGFKSWEETEQLELVDEGR